jgi:hypothetical protein
MSEGYSKKMNVRYSPHLKIHKGQDQPLLLHIG